MAPENVRMMLVILFERWVIFEVKASLTITDKIDTTGRRDNQMFIQNFQSGPKRSSLIQYGGRMWEIPPHETDRLD